MSERRPEFGGGVGGSSVCRAPLSILHLVNSLGAGGAERFVTDLTLAQLEAGHKVGVIPLSSAQDLGDQSGLAEERTTALRAAGAMVRVLGHRHRRTVLTAAFPLKRLIAEAEPDIVHSHLPTALALLRVAGCRSPIVATHPNTPLPAGRFLYRMIASRARAFAAICKPAVPILKEVFRGPVEVIHNGARDHSLPRVSKRREDPLRILSAGRMTAQKDYLHLVEIADALRSRGVRARFRIAGGGPEKPAVEKRIRTLGLEETVVPLGDRNDVPRLMAESDVYLITSRWEGMPNIALIEALQTGLPIVASDMGGCADAVGPDGHAGFVVPVGDTGAFADRLGLLASDAALRARMGRAARARAQLFGIEAAAKAYEALYRRVLG